MNARPIRDAPVRWRIEPTAGMRVPGVIFASDLLMPDIEADRSIEQVANVATLPGVVEASYAMPDIHWGYGFPIGGVAAIDVDAGGVVSPGGVGFDISCGVRLHTSQVSAAEIAPTLRPLMDALDRTIPRGLGKGSVWSLEGESDLDQVMLHGAEYAVANGFGCEADLERCDGGGGLTGADPSQVSARARDRGLLQVGSLGSGNHFLEVQVVDAILDIPLADGFGLYEDQICVMIHCGSRGLGHQICQDHVGVMEKAMSRYGISVPDKQLACAPVESDDGRAYLGAMAAAANFGRANRQVLGTALRRAFARAVGPDELPLLYDVSHNLAQIEEHEVDGKRRRLCVHRKGATPARPPGDPSLPAELAKTGQPVLVPGSMGTASYVMAGMPGGGAFHSTCHGAGRTMSRAQAKKRIRGAELKRELEEQQIVVRASSERGLAEEAPFSYKDVDEVVRTCEAAGLAKRVARLRPIGVVKG